MKLKNKISGEIKEFFLFDGKELQGGATLKSLAEEWEDAPEEPKKHYEILAMGAVMEREDAEDEIFRNQGQREIGNYFDTREEAELAVEKLKAWKRLKDKGFKFADKRYSGHIGIAGILLLTIEASIKGNDDTDVDDDLDLLFGGEE